MIVPSSLWPNNDDLRTLFRLVNPEFSVIGSIDYGNDETMDIDLSKVRPDVKEIIICVSIYDAKNRNQNFGQVEIAYVRLYKPGTS